MLEGQRIDDDGLRSLFNRASFFVAHNAPFDRAFLTRLFPEMSAKPWLCSMRGVDWLSLGCAGRSLELLRSYSGLDSAGAHRAAADAEATLYLLSQRDRDGRPLFGSLLDRLPGNSPNYVSAVTPYHDERPKPSSAICHHRRRLSIGS